MISISDKNSDISNTIDGISNTGYFEDGISSDVRRNLIETNASVVTTSTGKSAILYCNNIDNKKKNGDDDNMQSDIRDLENINEKQNQKQKKTSIKNTVKSKENKNKAKTPESNNVVYVWNKDDDEAPIVTIMAGLYAPRLDKAYVGRVSVGENGALRWVRVVFCGLGEMLVFFLAKVV